MSIKNFLSNSGISTWKDVNADKITCDSLISNAIGTPLINTEDTPLILATNNNIGMTMTQDNPPKTVFNGDVVINGDIISVGDTFTNPTINNPTITAPIENSINPNTNILIEPGKYTKINNIQSTFLFDSNNLVRTLTSPTFSNLTVIGSLNGLNNLASTDTNQTFTNKTINSSNNLIQINGVNINTYLPTNYFASSQGVAPSVLNGRKEYHGIAVTNISGVATFFINSTGNIGGIPLFSSLSTSFFSCVAISNTSSPISVPLVAIKAVTSDTVTVNVVRGLTTVLASPTLQFAGSGITVHLYVIGN